MDLRCLRDLDHSGNQCIDVSSTQREGVYDYYYNVVFYKGTIITIMCLNDKEIRTIILIGLNSSSICDTGKYKKAGVVKT